MPNGYTIEKVGDYWQLKCRTKLLPEKYTSQLQAHAAALKADPCGKAGPKPKLEPVPEKKKKRQS